MIHVTPQCLKVLRCLFSCLSSALHSFLSEYRGHSRTHGGNQYEKIPRPASHKDGTRRGPVDLCCYPWCCGPLQEPSASPLLGVTQLVLPVPSPVPGLCSPGIPTLFPTSSSPLLFWVTATSDHFFTLGQSDFSKPSLGGFVGVAAPGDHVVGDLIAPNFWRWEAKPKCWQGHFPPKPVEEEPFLLSANLWSCRQPTVALGSELHPSVHPPRVGTWLNSPCGSVALSFISYKDTGHLRLRTCSPSAVWSHLN